LVTTLAAETISATTGAGVTLVDAHGKRSMAASDPTGRTRGCAAVPVRLRALSDRVARPGDGPGRRHRRGDPVAAMDGCGR
jgi:hypothetical protein